MAVIAHIQRPSVSCSLLRLPFALQEGSEVLSDEEGDDDEEAVESEEVDEAAAGIGALGITRWISE
jgi:hypothetical protein